MHVAVIATEVPTCGEPLLAPRVQDGVVLEVADVQLRVMYAMPPVPDALDADTE